MSEEQNALVEFITNVDWDKHADDQSVIKILKSIKNKVDAINDESGEDEKRAKVVIVGDGAVGKTCLFITYVQGKFPSEYVPTVFENYSSDVPYKGENYLLQMWDTAGQEDYDRLRPLSYPGTDVAILCFSLVSTDSFDSINEKWNPEITHFLPNVPKILVGTKLDLREAKIADPHTGVFQEITTDQGNKLAKEIGAVAYIEVSPLKGTNLPKVFEEVIKAAIASKDEEDAPKKKKSSKDKDRKHRKHRHRDEKDEDGKKKSSSRSSKSSDKDGEKKLSKSSSSKSSDKDKKERRSTRSSKTDDKKEGSEKKERRKKKDDKKESSSSKSSDKKKKV